MKSSLFCKLLSCLLFLNILTGCSKEPFDPETATDYVDVGWSQYYPTLKNAEGKELHWLPLFPDRPDLRLYDKPEGTMEFGDQWEDWGLFGYYLKVPYSRSLTVESPGSENWDSFRRYGFSAEFYKDGCSLYQAQVCSESLEAVITVWDDQSVEITGNDNDFWVWFDVTEDSGEYRYELKGRGSETVKVWMEGEDIFAEGMIGTYTAAKQHFSSWEEVWSQERQDQPR